MIAVNKDPKFVLKEDLNPNLVHLEKIIKFGDHFDNCIIGLASTYDRIIYDVDKIIDVIVEDGDGELTRIDAIEHFNYNMECACGPDGPVFMYPLKMEDLYECPPKSEEK